jgi:hypothetical protein
MRVALESVLRERSPASADAPTCSDKAHFAAIHVGLKRSVNGLGDSSTSGIVGSHLECPTFQRLLRAAERGAFSKRKAPEQAQRLSQKTTRRRASSSGRRRRID